MFNIIDVNADTSYLEHNLYLCRPNKRIVSKLKGAFNTKVNVKLGNIHELSFDIPYYVEENHEIIKNPLIDKIKLGFLVKLEFKGKTDYFVISNESKSLNSDGESISYRLQSQAYKLGKLDVYEFKTDTLNLSATIGDLLDGSESSWKLGYVNPDFDLLFRSVNIEGSTVLESIFTICETFGAVPEFDSERKLMNFQKLESTGINRGFEAKEGTFLESYDINTTLEEIVTRLKCYGNEGLEFRNLSVNGSNYVQDFSYFMYPFEHDGNYNVLKSSNYMSDELCIALSRYNDLAEQLDGNFKTLLDNKRNAQLELLNLQQNDSNLQTEKKTIENELDVINLTYGEAARARGDWLDVNNRLDNVISRINANNSLIQNTNSTITNIDSQINVIGVQLATENNFTQGEIDELSEYIFVREFSDENIITEEDLLQAGLEQFEKYKEPKVTLQFSIANFLNDFNFINNSKKINLGDIVTFNSKKFNTRVRTRITEIEYALDDSEIRIVTSNDLEKVTDEEILIDLLNNAGSASKLLAKNNYKLDLAVTANTEVNRIIEGVFDTSRNILLGGIENTNEMTERGFYSRDFQNPERTFLVINGGQMAITNDGGRSVEVAISKDGVIARRLIGSMILGNRLQIESESGVVSIFDNQINIKDNQGVNRVQLGRYIDPMNPGAYKYGLNVLNGAINISTSNNANQGFKLDASGMTSYNSNGARTFGVNFLTGDLYLRGTIESSTITGSVIQTSSQANRGIKLTNNGFYAYNTNGQLVTSIDASTGNLNTTNGNFSGTINASTINGGSIIGGTLTGGSIYGASIQGGSITSDSTINVTTDLRVGNNIYLGSPLDYAEKFIYFNNEAYILSRGFNMELFSRGVFTLATQGNNIIRSGSGAFGTRFEGGLIDFSQVGSIYWGNNLPQARFS